ncbi:MAG: DUF6783 domain-containing protein [Lacrimispora saccharolytica]
MPTTTRPTNCDAHLAESNFQTRSRRMERKNSTFYT